MLWRHRATEDNSKARLGVPPWHDGPSPSVAVIPLGHPQHRLADLSGRRTSLLNNGSGSGGSSHTEDLRQQSGHWTQTPGVEEGDTRPIGALTRHHITQLSGYMSGYRRRKVAVLTQVLTGKIGLAAFLFKRRVPGYRIPRRPAVATGSGRLPNT